MVLALCGDSTMTSDPPPLPLPLYSGASGSATFRRDLVAAFAFIVAFVAFFFFATDDARAEAPRPAMRLTVGLVASSEVFFFVAISLCSLLADLVHVHLLQPRPGLVEADDVHQRPEILQRNPSIELGQRPLDDLLQLRAVEGPTI